MPSLIPQSPSETSGEACGRSDLLEGGCSSGTLHPPEPSEGLRKNVGGGRSLYWRSLEEFADSEEFREIVAREFPTSATELVTPEDRRQFMKVMGASFALAGLTLTGCRRWPEQNIRALPSRPENRTPGEPLQYATAVEFEGFAQGLLVTSVDGRPIKVEGNPEHPLNRGATDALAQAAILDLYDIDRSREVHRGEAASTWAAFVEAAGPRFAALRQSGGEGLAVLSEPTSSPSAQRLRERFAKELPKARLVEWQAVDHDNERLGTTLAFGKPHRVHLRFADEEGDAAPAKVVLSLDADFLLDHPAAIRLTREFATIRRTAEVAPEAAQIARLYMFDSGCSLTGVMADEREAVRAVDVAPIAARIAVACGVTDAGIAQLAASPSASSALDDHGALVVEDCAKDLLASRGQCVVVAGRHQPPEVHAIAALLNEALGNVGSTVFYTPEQPRPGRTEALAGLAKGMSDGSVSTLVVLGCNPVYDAPVDLGFAAALARVPFSVHIGLYRDETGRRCTWHLPMAHPLESWSDARSFDGTYTLGQPLIAPMIDPGQGGHSLLESFGDVLAWTAGAERGAEGRTLVQETFAAMVGSSVGAAEVAWRKALHDGFLPGTATGAVVPSAKAADVFAAAAALATRLSAMKPDALEVVFRPDAKIRDGRHANNAWLQELPEPISKLTWDNAAVISLGTAKRLGVARGDMLKVEVGGRSLDIAALPLPGHPDNSISIALGYGRDGQAGRVADGAGFNAYLLRTSAQPDIAEARASKTAGQYVLVSTQDRGAGNAVAERGIQDRLPTLVREASLTRYKRDPSWVKHPTSNFHVASRLSLWEENNLAGARHRWAMTVDLSTCTGCNACVVACQAENNVPVVGKEQVRRGREMSWIRIDRYFKGRDPAKPVKTLFQPVTCMHCENAPCEQVCPVAATVHDEEGLNVMVYNRCVGTRYCSNNCPYKVRRFNYFDWHRMDLKRTSDWIQPQADYYIREQSNEWKRMQFNPEVTVRMRGVMEKCTFCTQRIVKARIDAKNEWARKGGREGGTSDYEIRDGAIVPACAQACPAQAIVFGDLNDPKSRVSKLFKAKLAYEMLEELHTRPRLRYLARLGNPAHDHDDHDHDHDHGHGHGHHHGAAPAATEGGRA